ncbi:type III polyketide synthase [Sphingomonas crusticola]|uniref:type III polyketide synthase n=1 Tax=Sphingomonas crusticola TaxID=1697973 RepID=UPI000E24207B|nr:type III polyketide synthase [Sphingomonas crusticola]
MLPIIAHINRIGTAVPDHDIHGLFVDWAHARIEDPRAAKLFRRMADRAGIERRWSVLTAPPGGSQIDGGFYDGGMPPTSARMTVYAEEAPRLALAAIAQLGELGEISHIVVASCTGFVAPGIDQILARELGLAPTVERTLVGFMGCYAAIAALRVAHHIVRSTPDARVLVVMVELCTLHLQGTTELEPLLAMLQFGDGAGAAIVSAEPTGFAIDRFFAHTLPDSAELIGWKIGDEGFVMHLAGAVPNRIGEALHDEMTRNALLGEDRIDRWAVHAGGRSVLDAVERSLDLPEDALADSRAVLAEKGNMSSATVMFVLERMLARGGTENGLTIAFGPGLAAEGFHFRSVA